MAVGCLRFGLATNCEPSVTASAVIDYYLGTGVRGAMEHVMNRQENSIEDYDEETILQTLRELIDEGSIEMSGRLASGEPVYRVTGERSRRWMWRRVGATLGILPSLVAEYVLGYSAIVIATFCGHVQPAVLLATAAERLIVWRERATTSSRHVWPSIRY